MPTISDTLAEAKKISEENAKLSFYRVSTLRVKDGEVVFLRFIDRRAITVGMHSYIPVKPKPEEFKGTKWPESMFGVCQNDKMFRLRGEDGSLLDEFEEGYGDCYICRTFKGRLDAKFGRDVSVPSSQVFGLAVVRKPRTDPVTGAVIGFADETEEFKAEDKTVHTIPKMVLVSQKFSNFWHPIMATMWQGGSICERDWRVERKDKDYVVSGDKTPDLAPGTASWKRYSDALALTGFDLAEYLVDLSTPDHYARWFDPDKSPKDGYARRGDDSGEEGREPAGNGDEAVSQGSGMTPEQVAEYREKLKAGRGA